MARRARRKKKPTVRNRKKTKWLTLDRLGDAPPEFRLFAAVVDLAIQDAEKARDQEMRRDAVAFLGWIEAEREDILEDLE